MIKYIYLFLFLLFPMTASAWEQTMTCGDYGYPCGNYEPLPTSWNPPCVSFHLNDSGTSHIPFEHVLRITEKSVQAWMHPDKSSLTPHLSGLTNEDRIGYNPYIDENTNIIVFRDENWMDSRSMMALTTVTHHNATGHIYDADIELNTTHWQFGNVDTDGPSVVDLQNTLTHEIGHVFGLAHSGDADATMFAFADEGVTSLRTLENDDLVAISTIYPVNGETCKFNDGYFEKPPYAMDEAPPPDDSCSTNLPSPIRTSYAIWMLFGLVILTVRYSRKRHTVRG